MSTIYAQTISDETVGEDDREIEVDPLTLDTFIDGLVSNLNYAMVGEDGLCEAKIDGKPTSEVMPDYSNWEGEGIYHKISFIGDDGDDMDRIYCLMENGQMFTIKVEETPARTKAFILRKREEYLRSLGSMRFTFTEVTRPTPEVK